jgi:site-specific recombinase XerD
LGEIDRLNFWGFGVILRGQVMLARLWLQAPPCMAQVAIDAWLVPPHNPPRQKRAADRRSRAMRLSALFEEFTQYLKVERGASHRSIDTYRRYFGYFQNFAKDQVGGSVLIAHFTSELCRSYQYFMAAKELQSGSIRVRLAVLGSFGKWAVKHSRLEKNPMEVITLPAKRTRIPGVPKWEAVEQFLARCSRRRDKAMLALMVYGGLRRAEVVRLNIGDYQSQFGLRRVLGKGGHETTVPLPEVARAIVNEYLAKERPSAAASEPLFQVQYKWYGGEKKVRRMSGQRVWKIIKDLGKRVSVDTIHPHAFRHACGVELLKRSGGNLRAVQEHLRHADMQTTTIYTRLAPQDLQKVVNLFDEKNGGGAR